MKLLKPNGSITFQPTTIQDKAWRYLIDKETNVLLYGGAAGSGKSHLSCIYTLLNCFQYPGVVMGMTRARLIDIQKSTLITLHNILKSFQIKEGTHYTYDRKNNVITFWNGSKILIFDSYLYPQDPDFERLSSIEMTGCIIDEASQITKKAFNIIQSRLRYKHNEYNLIPKLLLSTNPCLNFLKSDIYEPYINGTLDPHIKVVLGRVQDNPHIDQSYIDNLEKLDAPVKSRLLYGDWNYASHDESIFQSDKLVNAFYNSLFLNTNSNKYLTCDVASSGQDKSVITIWNGLELIKIETYSHYTIPQLYSRITELMNYYHIQISNVIIDKTGVGVGLYDLLKGCIGFVANEKPKSEIYKMLKDELYYKLADYINNDKIKFSITYLKDEIVQELGAHIMYNYDKDNKTQILPKDKVKASIGRSPDLADAIMMRMYYENVPAGFTFTFV